MVIVDANLGLMIKYNRNKCASTKHSVKGKHCFMVIGKKYKRKHNKKGKKTHVIDEDRLK